MAELIDSYGRRIEYLRLSVTDRCDFRCFYCIPKGFKDFSSRGNGLRLDETIRLIKLFSELGVRKVRLTGGEPLVRRDIEQMIRGISGLPEIHDLSMSTNASQLTKHAAMLKDAGITRINVSLDSLKPEIFKQITQGDLKQVIAGLMAAKKAGLHPIKINMVVIKRLNFGEIGEMVDFCLKHGFTLRFIETMPIGEAGQQTSEDFVSLERVRCVLQQQLDLEPAQMQGAGPARYVRVKGTDLKIGFITPLSQHFCETCNRVRLSSEGTLFLCLGQHDRVELKPLLRQGLDDAALKTAILEAINKKPEKHEFNNKPKKIVRIMSMTGG